MFRLWLIFAQTATVILAIFFVVSTLRPELLPWRPHSTLVTIKEAASVGGNRIDSFNTAAERAMPSVVNIFTRKEVKEASPSFFNDPLFQRFFGQRLESKPRKISNLGSGVITSRKGYILTNHHVVAAADEIKVTLIDGRITNASVIGSDPDTDLAVLKINLKNLPVITFGQSEEVKVGDIVLAVGNPFGVGQTVTMGIVGALGRSQVGINTFENFIQTDAAINPGNSGGALTDTSGNLIGINTAIYSQTGGSLGVGFAVPVNVAKQVMAEIIATGYVTRGWLGVSLQDVTPELAESFELTDLDGVLIAGVLKDGPADKAGVKPGDVLRSIAGKSMNDSSSVLNNVAELPPGNTATLTIMRDNQEIEIKVKIGKRPK